MGRCGRERKKAGAFVASVCRRLCASLRASLISPPSPHPTNQRTHTHARYLPQTPPGVYDRCPSEIERWYRKTASRTHRCVRSDTACVRACTTNSQAAATTSLCAARCGLVGVRCLCLSPQFGCVNRWRQVPQRTSCSMLLPFLLATLLGRSIRSHDGGGRRQSPFTVRSCLHQRSPKSRRRRGEAVLQVMARLWLKLSPPRTHPDPRSRLHF